VFNKFFKKEKRNCLSCAFCLRNKKYKKQFITNNGISQFLTKKERLMATSGDFDFFKEERNKIEEWEIIFNQKREELDRKEWDQIRLKADEAFKDNKLYKNIKHLLSKNDNNKNYTKCRIVYQDNSVPENELKELGLEPCPPIPDKDYLFCWHEQWNENKNPELIPKRADLTNRKCQFYFPFDKKGDKTLEACEKERGSNLDHSRFLITCGLTILAIIGLQTMINWFSNIDFKKNIINVRKNTVKQKQIELKEKKIDKSENQEIKSVINNKKLTISTQSTQNTPTKPEIHSLTIEQVKSNVDKPKEKENIGQNDNTNP
jgi:hypothetical protein